VFDFNATPPKRWIEQTLGDPINMVRIGDVLTMMTTKDPEDNLALQILADAPAYCYGTDSANGRTHALWALMQLNRNNQLPAMIAPLKHVCGIWFKQRVYPPVPTELLFMYAYASMRLTSIDDVKLALVLAHRRRLSIPQETDLNRLFRSVPDEPTPTNPSQH
jgi:hypothetical protein